jgi:hypothetical protein
MFCHASVKLGCITPGSETTFSNRLSLAKLRNRLRRLGMLGV